MTTIEKILEERGPLMSSEVAKILSETEKTKLNSASQRVVRAKEILQIKGFFKSNQSLCYLPQHSENPDILKIVAKAMYENGKKYWYTMNALKLHEGIISQKYLECYTNYPVLPLKKHIPFPIVMQNFVAQDILIFNENDYIISPKFSKIFTNLLVHKTIELIKDSVLTSFHSLSRNVGLISYDSGELFGEFGKLRWGFKGASYVMGVRQNTNPGFMLADILVGRRFYKDDVLFFIEKLKLIQSYKNASHLIPVLLIDNLEKEAFIMLKRHGVVVGFIKELFGQQYADALKELISMLKNAGASLKKNPAKYLDLIAELKKYNEGLLNNIRGTLFEFAIGHIHSKICKSIDIGREVFFSGSRHEMDVLAIYGDKIIIAECKATKGQVDDAMVEKWLNKKIPAFRNWLISQETLKEKIVEFEYWSTSGFTEGARLLLNKQIASNASFKVSYFGPDELRNRAKEMKDKKLKETLDNFFIDPMV